MSAVVAVIGEGWLANLVSDRLGGGCRIIRQLDLRDGAPRSASLGILLQDGWDPDSHRQAEESFRRTGTPWLRGFVQFGEGVVGPWVRPGKPGCSHCSDWRKTLAGGDRKEMWSFRQQFMERGKGRADAWSSKPGLRQMACLIADEAVRVLRGDPPLTENSLYLIPLTTLHVTRHFILPDPQCPVCGVWPDDSPGDAAIRLAPRPKTNSDSLRCRPMAELKSVLARDYVDARTGLLNGRLFDLQSPFADATVNLPMFGGDEGAAGRTHRYTDSLQTAILEGLERHCGLVSRRKRPVVRGSYRSLREFALNPLSVGVHAPAEYAKPDFPFRAFDEDREVGWVWGYSLGRERSLLVPEALAYYGTGNGEETVYETSNGCALGGCLEEAILHGILEVVERDSFLITWYGRLKLPRLDPVSAGDTELTLMTERLSAVSGYEVQLFNSTMEHGIPSVWSIAKNTTGKGVNLICAAGAHPDPVRAAKSSVHELSAMLHTQTEKFEANRQTYAGMLEDPYRVRQMEDHAMLYALPEAEGRLGFLLKDNGSFRTFREEYGTPSLHSDLTEDLKGVLRRLHRIGLDVIVVDQTSPEIRRNGLHCVKVIVPGLLPMTFGYRLTRLTGLDRVLQVPYKLGYAAQPLTEDQLNPYPHPFP